MRLCCGCQPVAAQILGFLGIAHTKFEMALWSECITGRHSNSVTHQVLVVVNLVRSESLRDRLARSARGRSAQSSTCRRARPLDRTRAAAARFPASMALQPSRAWPAAWQSRASCATCRLWPDRSLPRAPYLRADLAAALPVPEMALDLHRKRFGQPSLSRGSRAVPGSGSGAGASTWSSTRSDGSARG
jgi:hypothetical protein